MSDIKLYADLYGNALTGKEGDCTARPRINGTLYNADIARRIVEKRTEYRLETIENILKMADEEKSVSQATVGPVIGGLTDSATGKDDGTFTPGMPIVVGGNNLKITGADQANGFYFIPAADGGAPVKATVIVHNNPSQLTVMVPTTLSEGDYYICITTQYGCSATVKEPRSYKYPILLSTAGSGGDDDDRPVIE